LYQQSKEELDVIAVHGIALNLPKENVCNAQSVQNEFKARKIHALHMVQSQYIHTCVFVHVHAPIGCLTVTSYITLCHIQVLLP